VNYAEQEQYLRASRWWAIAIIALLLLIAAPPLCIPLLSRYSRLCYALIIAAIAGSIFYTPNYLHLTVNTEKPARWQIKIRWRIIAAVLVLGLIPARSVPQILIVLGPAAWLALVNLGAPSFGRFCRRVGMPDLLPGYFLLSDFLLIVAWAGFFPGFLPQVRDFIGWPWYFFAAALLVASAHLAVVTARHPFVVATLAVLACTFLFLRVRVDAVFRTQTVSDWQIGRHTLFIPLPGALCLVFISAIGAAFLVHRAQRRNRANVSAALAELTQFTGYSEARARELWATSDRQLAQNWQSANLDLSEGGASPEKLAAWYRDNSELYLFAISAYNLDYKRIVSNLGVLRLARGRTLDYGAGNGELLLELARRGHAVAYYDVEGVTMQFARGRARQRGLEMQFFAQKSDLAAAAENNVGPGVSPGQSARSAEGFDTIFSFDVLEHLPDLAGELTFLSSLLNPGGQFVFDVPSGATRNHPMHLDHRLDFVAHLRSLGLEQVFTWRDRLPWRKEEKYRFRRPD
jgi:SAM-dependent methyltransferase